MEAVATPERGRLVRDRRPVLSTIHSGVGGDLRWDAAVTSLPSGKGPVWLVRSALSLRRRQALIVQGTSSFRQGYRDQQLVIAARVMRWRGRVVISDATLDEGSAALAWRLPAWARPTLPRLKTMVIRALDSPRTTWCVLSTEEKGKFAARWRLEGAADRVVFTPFSYTVDHARLAATVRDDHFWFSGGDSLRDYRSLLAAVGSHDVPLRVATRQPLPHLPAGVTAGPTSHPEFVELLTRCSALVLPLQLATRSTGQQTYLNAMVLAKPVVVTDAPGVRDYVEDGVTGLLAAPGAQGLRTALDRLVSLGPEGRARMGAAARRAVLESSSPEAYRARLLRQALQVRAS